MYTIPRDRTTLTPRTRIECYGTWTVGQRVIARPQEHRAPLQWATLASIPRRSDGTVYVRFDTPDHLGLRLEEADCFQLPTNHKYHDAGESWARPVNQRDRRLQ